MKKIYILSILVSLNIYSQNGKYVAWQALQPLQPLNFASINYLPVTSSDVKVLSKEISQFRAKEFIINNIIGPTNGKEIRFETESLASDDSGGLITVAFNCDEANKKGLLLAFIGNNKNQEGQISKAYGFRPILLADAQALLTKLDDVRKRNEKYLSGDSNVNNVYMEYEDIKFVIYKDLGSLIRVFWNGFEVVWEDTAFNRSKRRLDKWFK